MDVGLIIPQGWTGEYEGWEPRHAWARSMHVARTAERLGFDSVWVFDHFHTVPEATEQITFESFTTLSALAATTGRVGLGHVVLCAAYRNAALTAKMAATLDVISGGRMTLGIGAGWKEDEWLAYGYSYPDTPTRLAILRDHLEVVTRMLRPGRATYRGEHASVDGAINVPLGVTIPHVPVMVGGNGPKVTWRLAARHADELNLDWLDPGEVIDARRVIAARCEEIGRDPTTLRISVNINRDVLRHGGSRRVDLLAAYREAGVDRVMGLLRSAVDSDEPLEALAADARAARATMHA